MVFLNPCIYAFTEFWMIRDKGHELFNYLALEPATRVVYDIIYNLQLESQKNLKWNRFQSWIFINAISNPIFVFSNSWFKEGSTPRKMKKHMWNNSEMFKTESSLCIGKYLHSHFSASSWKRMTKSISFSTSQFLQDEPIVWYKL